MLTFSRRTFPSVNRLPVHDGPRSVGAFERVGDAVHFRYSPGYDGTPLSLSLPLDRPHSAVAASCYLGNLVPENEDFRRVLFHHAGFSAQDNADLTWHYGGDCAGAGIFGQQTSAVDPMPISSKDLGEHIRMLRQGSSRWIDLRSAQLLSGYQPKFALRYDGQQWSWPDAHHPSTHIIKPAMPRFRHVEQYEYAALRLATEIGIPATQSQVAEYGGEPVFIAQRWDRVDGQRRHAEDLCSALGVPAGSKYGVQAAAIAHFLDRYGQSGAFIRQLAFNVAIGNGDAHAKNYSVLLDGESVELAPLYDCVPTMLFGDHTFAQRIGTARQITSLTPATWVSFAQEAHLAPEFVCENATPVINAVAQHLEYAFADADLTPQGRKAITKRVKALRRYCLASRREERSS